MVGGRHVPDRTARASATEERGHSGHHADGQIPRVAGRRGRGARAWRRAKHPARVAQQGTRLSLRHGLGYHRETMNQRQLVVAVTVVLLVGCAAASKKPKQASDPDSFAKDDKSEASTSSPGEKSDMGKTMKEHETDYLAKCAKSPDYKAWCDCAWGIYGTTITLGEMNKGEIDPKKLQQVNLKSAQVCGDKMPEALVKDAFAQECMQDNARLKPFCECLWPGLRKSLAPTEIADKAVRMSDKFTQVGGGVARACAGKLPEAEVSKAFQKSCTDREGAQNDKYCECVWKQVRGAMSHAEVQLSVVTGTIDIHKGQQKVHKACDKLKVD